MKIKSLSIITLVFLFLIVAYMNPLFAQSQKFINEDSDAKAIKIADEVMKASGGIKNWDATHYIAWNFLAVANYFGINIPAM